MAATHYSCGDAVISILETGKNFTNKIITNTVKMALKYFKTKLCDAICIKVVSNKKWYILFIYRPPKQSNELFFQEN